MNKPSLKEALEDPRAGPRPISIEEYRRRNSTPRQPTSTIQQAAKKEKTGKEVRFRRDIREAVQDWFWAQNKEARVAASVRINRLKTERKIYRQNKLRQKKMLAQERTQK